MIPKLHLIHTSGRVAGPFDTVDALVDYASAHDLINDIGDKHTVVTYVRLFRKGEFVTDERINHYDWIVRNDFNEVITRDLIWNLWRDRRDAARKTRAAKIRGFRDRPVPRTGRYRRRRYVWLRRIRTTAENRLAAGHGLDRIDLFAEDGIVVRPIRAKRAKLPTAWDDFLRLAERGWKAHRRTQYKQH